MEAPNPLDTHALLPCPFCGRAATVKRDEFDLPMGRKDIMFFVECCLPECRNRTCNWFPLKAAVAAWNRRAHAHQGAAPAPKPCGTCGGARKVDSGGQGGAGQWIERDRPGCTLAPTAPAPYADHWAVKRPGLADQFRGEAVAARVALGLGDEKSDDVSPSDITEAIAKMRPLDQSCIAIWKDGTWMWTSERGAEEYSGDDNFLTWVKVGKVHQEAPTPGGVEAAARAAVKAYNEWCRSRASWMDDWMDAMAKLEEALYAPAQGSPQEGESLDLEAIEARAKKFAKRLETTTAFDDLTRHTKWFAACATTDIPALIAEVRRLRSALAKAEGKPA